METVQQTADIESFAQQFGTQANAVRRNYMEGQDLQEYELGSEATCTMGRDGGKAESLNNSSLPGLKYLSQSQREIAFSLGKDAAAAQNAVTATTEMPAASDATQTIQISTGAPVEIARISNVDGNGCMTFELADGRTVNADDIQHTHSGEAVLYEAVADLGASAEVSNRLVDAWKDDPGGVSAESYAAGMIEAFNYGRYNIPVAEMAQNESIQHLTAGQRNTAYQLGKAYGNEITQAKEAKIQNAGTVSKAQNRSGTAAQQTAASRPGGDSAGASTGTGKVHFDRQGRTLSAVQETGLKTMEQLSQLFGTEFHVFESYEKDGKRVFQDENGVEQSAPNGWYDPRTGHIHIDLNAGSGGRGTMLFTVAHELTHFIRDWSPAKFDKLAEAVFELVYKEKNISVVELVRKQQAKAARNGMELTFDEAYEEVVADSMESILTSGNVVELMAEVKQQDQSLWQKIRKWFQDLAKDIRKMIDAYAGYKPDSAEGRAVAAMEEMLPVIESFYMDALQEASANYQAAEGQKNTTQEGGKKNSFAGRNAATADHSALQQAKQLQEQGVDNETIRQRIGWFKGMDGKWRFEIDDSQMVISENLSNYMRLGDLMQHEKLYAAYPDMADIDVVFQSLDAGVSGSYHPQFDSINLSYKLKNDPIGLKDALVHEIQHTIQQREGFTKGATAESWERKKKAGFDSRRAADIRKAHETERELRRIQEEEPEFYRDMVELDAMTPDLPRGEIDWETLEKIEDDPVEWQQYDARREELEAKYGDTKVWDMNDLLYQREQAAKNVGRSGVELYFDTAGEIEARDASNRRSKSPEQRKSSPPRLGNEDTVFAEGNAPADDYIPGIVSKKEIADNINAIAEMESVVSIKGDEFKMGDGRLLTDVTAFFESIGGSVYNKRLGDVYLRKRGVRHDLGHGMSDEKAASFAAIPAVLEQGRVAGFVVNKDSKGFDSATVIAPITIGNEPYMMGVIVHRSNKENRFYVHDVVAIKEEAAPLITGTHNVGETGGATSTISIIRKILSVKAKQVASGKKFSHRDPLQEKAVKALEKENAQLKEDVSRLRDLVKLQKKLTGGKMVKPSSVESAARVLKKTADATGDTKELAKLLGEFYAYIANGEELTWEGVQEAAQGAADWLWNNRKQTTDEYSAEILKDLRTRGVSFNEDQKSKAAVTHDTFANYRKALFGSVKITENGMPLDEAWHELSGLYPGVFLKDTNSGDMPRALVDIVTRLRSSDGTYMGYDEIMARQSLIRDVYDSYWNVPTLYTIADVKQKEINALKSRHAQRMSDLQKEINALKSRHAQRMSDLRTKHREKVEQLHLEQKAAVEAVRAAERQRSQERTRKALDKHRENQKQVAANRAERREKTEVRRKIRKAVMELNKLLNRGDKKKNVKDGMSEMVSKSLKLAEALFMDEYSNRDMLRNGVGIQMTDAEEKLFREAYALLEKIEGDSALAGKEFGSEIEAMKYLRKLDGQLSGKMAKLNDVFVRERKRLYATTVSDLLGQLADEYSRLSEAEDGAVRAAKDENVYAHLLQLQKDVGGVTVRDMTLSQMKMVADAYTMVLTTVRNANKMFAKNLKFKRDTLAGMVMGEIGAAAKKISKLVSPGKDAADRFSWNNLKPVYAFERLGSQTLKTLFGNIRKGQDVWAVDMQEADAFRREQYREHKRKDWDMEKQYSFEFESGKVDLSLEQIMSLYAYSRREAALDHLLKGGFVFGGSTEVFVKKNGIKRRYLKKDATAYNLTADELTQVIDTLSAEQKAFVQEMQTYLSDVMGGKGNEVSLQMYGIKSFGEKNYFPLRSAGQYMEKAKEDSFRKEQGQISIVNSGFTKATTPHASNPKPN